MTTSSKSDQQSSLFPDDSTIVQDEPVVEPKRNSRSMPEFSPLPPMPEGEDIPIEQYAERAYLAYAVSVVKGRALPDVCDGQKPVQRRILYAMQQMGLSHGSKHVKSARVVGDVLGKYHPHGDASAYDAMVRLAQDFSVRYPLIDGQGNFGTRDGDNAAAMRYTETRLTPLAELLLGELEKGTVDFVPNYDGAFKEPSLLPARLPMVLLNGASGIAVGMATEIPSHNLREIAEVAVLLLQQPELSDEILLNYIQGPDFPGGGQIISSASDIRDCYLSGRGSIKMRARWQIEELARGQWQIVVEELPHGVSTRKVLEEIDALSNPKIRPNKKSLSPDQQQNKQLLLSVLESVADESDKSQAVRLVFQPKSSRQTSDDLMNVLLAHTSLETSVSVNLTMIGLDGRPQQKSLPQIVREWVEFRVITVKRRCEFRLSQVNDRLHILAGRMIVYLNIDEVIAIIRESDEPKAALMARFELSERQAEDILEIRLRQLARLEGIKIEKEIKGLEKEKRELTKLLSKEALLREKVASEIAEDALKYGDNRRTLIKESEKSVIAVPVVDEPVTVIVSKKHWVRCRTGHGLDLSNTNFKTGDGLLAIYECRSTDYCIAICDNGRVCSVSVSALPSGRGDGAPLASLIELAAGAKIEQVICGASKQHLLLATSAGNGFYCTINDMLARNKAGKQFINLPDPAAHILTPYPFELSDSANVISVSKSGRLLVFALAELKYMASGGKGILLMGLAEGDELAYFAIAKNQHVHIHGKIGKRIHVVKINAKNIPDFIAKRARGGRILQNKFEPQQIEILTAG